jgi:hypothetical protein
MKGKIIIVIFSFAVFYSLWLTYNLVQVGQFDATCQKALKESLLTWILMTVGGILLDSYFVKKREK